MKYTGFHGRFDEVSINNGSNVIPKVYLRENLEFYEIFLV